MLKVFNKYVVYYHKYITVIIFFSGRAGVRLEDRLRRRIEEYRIRQRRKQMLQSVKAMKSGLAGLNKLRSDVPEKSSPPIVGMFTCENDLKIGFEEYLKVPYFNVGLHLLT